MSSITLTDPVSGTVVASGLISTNNSSLRNLLNGNIDGNNLKGSPALTSGEVPVWDGSQFVRSSATKVGATSLGTGTPDSTVFLRGDGVWASPSATGIPPGVMTEYAAGAAPAGWVLCDGASYVRTAPYDALFAIIGTTYGSADGSHFNVPDLRGRVPVGKGSNATVSALGNNDGVAEANRRPKHRHTAHSHTFTTYNGGAGSSGARSDAASTTPFNSGSTSSVDGGSGNVNDSLDAPAYIVLNYIIKL